MPSFVKIMENFDTTGSSSSNPAKTIFTNGAISSNNSHLHRGSKSATNLLQNYAPTSLPIGLSQMMANNGSNPAAAAAAALNSGIAYIPYSMSSDAVNSSIPKNSSTMTSSSSLSSS